jgi:hypothetical protein
MTNTQGRKSRPGGSGARTIAYVQVLGALVLCLLQGYFLWRPAINSSRVFIPSLPGVGVNQTAPPLVRWTSPRRSHGQNERADALLYEARWWRMQAILLANQDRETIEGWDATGASGADPEVLRRQLMLRDRCGYLRRSRAAALRGSALAHTPRQAYLAAELLVCIECETGHHDTELEEARKMIALAPHEWTVHMVFERAKRCSQRHPSAFATATRSRLGTIRSAHLSPPAGLMKEENAG